MAPPFKEKEFLLYLLSLYEKEHGLEIRHLETHEFGLIVTELDSKFSGFENDHGHTDAHKTREWFDEAAARGFLKPKHDGSFYYHFTKEGFQKSLFYKNPALYMFKYKKGALWAAGFTILNTLIAAVSITQQC